MSDNTTGTGRAHGSMRVPRSRGALTGLLLIVLGVWGGVIPFVGPYFNYAYTPDSAWTWTAGRFWLEILPAIAAIVGGFCMLTTANRSIAVFGGWLASAAGAWFVLGPTLGQLWGGPEGAIGTPVGTGVQSVVEQIGFFYGLGVVILFLAAQASGRFTVRSVRDVRAVERHDSARDDNRADDVSDGRGRRDTSPRQDTSTGNYPTPGGTGGSADGATAADEQAASRPTGGRRR